LPLVFSGWNGKTNSSPNGSVESASNAGAARQKENELPGVQSTSNSYEQPSSFVRRIFQDKSGNLWFATHHKGLPLGLNIIHNPVRHRHPRGSALSNTKIRHCFLKISKKKKTYGI